jgi:hypothetical protein
MSASCTQHHTEITDATLDDVHDDDKGLVREVISLLSAMQHPCSVCKSWSVNLVGTNYEVNGFIDTKSGSEWEVFYEDLDLIRQLDYARVGPISIRGTGASVHVRVRVTAKSVPVMVTQCDIIRVQKRRRWFGL